MALMRYRLRTLLILLAITPPLIAIASGRELESEFVMGAVREAGHQWREGELGPVATVKMFLLQILFGNVACEFVPHLAGKDVTGSAYCTARGRLPLEALQTLLSRCTTKMAACVRDTGLWLRPRLFVAGGAGVSRPGTSAMPAGHVHAR